MTAEWVFNSHDLTTDGDYRTTLLDGADDLPDVRGEDITIPFQHGQTWVEKYFDARVVTMSINIIGTDATDKKTNLDTLLGILGYRQHGLLVRTLPDNSTLQAYAEVVKRLGVVHHGPYLALATVEFRLADPFFRGTSLTTVTTTIDATPKTFTVTNPGSAPETKALITLTGPLSHPTITNTTNGAAVQYDDTLATSGDIVVLDCDKLTAVLGGSTNVIDKVIHTGAPQFMTLAAGNNAMSVTDGTHTTGTIQFDFYAPSF